MNKQLLNTLQVQSRTRAELCPITCYNLHACKLGTGCLPLFNFSSEIKCSSVYITLFCHSSRHGSSQEFPRLVHSTCTRSAPALEMHSVQVLEMLVQMPSVQGVSKSCKKCFISKRVLQNSYVIQRCPRSVQVVKF